MNVFVYLPAQATFAERLSNERSFYFAMFEERASSDEFCEINKAKRGSEGKRGATGARASK